MRYSHHRPSNVVVTVKLRMGPIFGTPVLPKRLRLPCIYAAGCWHHTLLKPEATAADVAALIAEACPAGVYFVKISSSFHPAGGATVHALRLMKQTVGGRAQVKASGGVRTYDDAIAMIDAGASRLGVSGSAALLSGGTPVGTY